MAWRWLLDGAAPGPFNMGVDEALLAAAETAGTTTLRLYRWAGPWLSLGYGQEASPERRAACEAAGVGIVGRSTGGLAVLHGEDLTYSLAAPVEALPPGLDGSYSLVADALCRAFAELGVAVERHTRPASRAEGFDCFGEPARHEILAGGRKLVGSAQRRTARGVLQHGSIRVRPDPVAVREAAGLDTSRATSLEEQGFAFAEGEVAQAIARAFAASFDASLGGFPEAGTLTSAEREAARARGAQAARVSGNPHIPILKAPDRRSDDPNSG